MENEIKNIEELNDGNYAVECVGSNPPLTIHYTVSTKEGGKKWAWCKLTGTGFYVDNFNLQEPNYLWRKDEPGS